VKLTNVRVLGYAEALQKLEKVKRGDGLRKKYVFEKIVKRAQNGARHAEK
jgi:hypothetical protein